MIRRPREFLQPFAILLLLNQPQTEPHSNSIRDPQRRHFDSENVPCLYLPISTLEHMQHGHEPRRETQPPNARFLVH